jgi:hypothetical protein
MLRAKKIHLPVVVSLLLLLCSCARQECAPPAPAPTSSQPALSYYDFSAPLPENGFCETQVFGPKKPVQEPWNMLTCIPVILLGAIGVVRSRRAAMSFRYLYGLLAAYGLAGAMYHTVLANGFYRIMDVTISLTQAFVIILLVHSLYLYRKESRGEREGIDPYSVLVDAVTFFFTLYPAVVHVAGESSASPWVAWLVFDLLWILIAFLLVQIWRRRDSWPRTAPNQKVFLLVWYALGFCALAYAAWCIDKFVCSCQTPWPAYLGLYGWWNIFMGLCFYSMITLSCYFSAQEYGFKPVYMKLWGVLPFVDWRRE